MTASKAFWYGGLTVVALAIALTIDNPAAQDLAIVGSGMMAGGILWEVGTDLYHTAQQYRRQEVESL